MTQTIEVRTVKTRGDRRQFIKFPWKIYAGDPNWVPPLKMDYKKMLTPGKHPYYEHGDVEFFMAFKNGKLAGRMTAHTNTLHNEIHRDKVGFFGFFECEDDPDCARALFDAGGAWLKSKGMDTMRGPDSFSQNEIVGLLVDAFDMPPMFDMAYNPPYYEKLVDGYGFKLAKNLYAYRFYANQEMPEKVARVAEMIKKRKGIEVRTVNFKDWDNELVRVKRVYNTAWTLNWGFCPITEAEFQKLVHDLKPVAVKDLVMFAFVDGQIAGISITLPDINVIIKEIKGRLFPFGFIKILTGVKKIKTARVTIMGVIHEYQKLGLDAVFYIETLKAARRLGIEWGELSWILEDNIPMVRVLENLGAEIYKTYKVYDYKLK
jgi:GNAT superfamily N-acetyltransferase